MKELAKVQSICPCCEKPVPAVYIERDGKVFFEKTCDEHGDFQALVATHAEDYLTWVSHPVVNVPPKEPITKGANTDECPLHCGTCENHMQTACCVLIDITKRCNQHCPYCFARAEMDAEDAGEPPIEVLEAKFDLLRELGEERPFNIQLSGGEPTVREDLPEIIKMAKDKGFEYVQINTNGKRLAMEKDYAKIIKEAGASVVFMQFDGTNDEINLALRGEPLAEIKKQAVENCRRAGLPVTLVPTILKNVNLSNIGGMIEFLLEHISVVKGIHFQPVSFFGRHPDPEHENRVTMFDVIREIEKQCEGFSYEDFCPITTGHTLCCFYSTYLKKGDGVECLVSEGTKASGASCCEPEPLEIIRKDRDYVLNKWDLPEAEEESCTDCCAPDPEAPMDMDQFLKYYKNNTFTVTGMAFQDASNLDAERLKRCRVQVLSEDNRLIPFCGYNSIYRGE